MILRPARRCLLALLIAAVGVAAAQPPATTPAPETAANTPSPRARLVELNERSKQVVRSETRSTTQIKGPILQSRTESITLVDRSQGSVPRMHSVSRNQTSMTGQPAIPSTTTLVADGQWLWVQIEVAGQVQVSRAPMPTGDTGELDGVIAQLDDARITALPDEVVGGVACHAFLVETSGHDYIKVCVEKETGVLRRLQTRAPNGIESDTVVTSYRTDVAIAPELLRYAPPEGVEVKELDAASLGL